MRVIIGIFTILFGLTVSAAADQTDPRLDLLFEELRTGDAVRAEENVARILDIWADADSDTIDLLYSRAVASSAQGNHDLALMLLDHVVGMSPSFAQGYALRGDVRLASGDRAGAIRDYSKVLELEPRHFEVRATLGGLYLASGDKRYAYEMYQGFLEWNPHDENVRRTTRALRRELDGQEI